MKPTPEMILDTLDTTITEEVVALQVMVVNPDSSCPARRLRQERIGVYESVKSLIEELRHWEW